MMPRSLYLVSGPAILLLACTVTDPLYCDEQDQCTDPGRPFCDLEGEYPASEGVGRTCIPDPDDSEDAGDSDQSDDGSQPDAGDNADTGAAKPCTPRLAFSSERDGNPEIYVTDADGTNQVNLTQSPAADREPEWSPDGSRMSFQRDGRLWTMDADGGNAEQLTAPPTGQTDLGEVAWSPDGARIAFGRTNGKGGVDIWIVDATGGEPSRLTDATPSTLPSWSPDGTTIAFTSSRDGDDEVFTMNSDGSGELNRTNNTFEDGTSSSAVLWSADGAQLYFLSDRDGSLDLWQANVDGGGAENLTASPLIEEGVVLSPDGSKILYAAKASGDLNDVYSMNADGTGQRNLTEDPATDDREPKVSPDGQHVAWISGPGDDAFDLYVSRIDGSERTRLTQGPREVHPDWQPCTSE
jgi:Tol biopolymer transport system component